MQVVEVLGIQELGELVVEEDTALQAQQTLAVAAEPIILAVVLEIGLAVRGL
jgi:hypothetical protein